MLKKINYYFDTDISLINASNVHVMKMCCAFVKNGYNVTLFCTGDPENTDKNSIFKAYGVDADFEIKVNKIPAFLKKYGHRLGPWYASWIKAKMQADDGYTYARSMMSLYFTRGKAPYVFEAHAEPDIINRQFERSILRHKNCRGLVVISNALKNRYMELFPFFSEEKIMVLHDAADPVVSDTDAKAELKGNGETVNIGYVGSLFPGKCMETLLPLAKSCPQYNFHIVGGTEYWIDLRRKEAEKEELNNVFFYGHVDNSKLGDYYRAFDLCILPSSKDVYIAQNKRVNIGKWTSPLKLFEAMAYGKPIIVSALETICEVMEDGVDCVLVEPDNIEEWTEKLTSLCNDKQMQQKIGAAALEKLKHEYTWTGRAKKAAQFFE